MIEIGHMDVLDVREAAEIAEGEARELYDAKFPYAGETVRKLSKRLYDLAARLDAAFQGAVEGLPSNRDELITERDQLRKIVRFLSRNQPPPVELERTFLRAIATGLEGE